MKFELLEGRIHGARYYTVKPVFPNLLSPINEGTSWGEMMLWCIETFGPSAEMGVWEPGAAWYANNAKFWFRREQDRIMFVLRWQ